MKPQNIYLLIKTGIDNINGSFCIKKITLQFLCVGRFFQKSILTNIAAKVTVANVRIIYKYQRPNASQSKCA